MAFSVKAQEIHDYIVNTGEAKQWTAVARARMSAKDRDLAGLISKLKADLRDVFPDASDAHWGEIANWLFVHARVGQKP